MPMAASASSKGGIWALVRTRTATSSRSTPALARRPISAATAPTSRSAVSKAATVGSGPEGRGATSRVPPGRRRPGARERVGRGGHRGGGAVVLLQPDQPGLGEPAGEAGQVLRGGPGEGVDGLVLVADHGQVAPLPQPGLQQRLLERV